MKVGAEETSKVGRKEGGRNCRVRQRGWATHCVVWSKHVCSLVLDLLTYKMGLYISPMISPHTHTHTPGMLVRI